MRSVILVIFSAIGLAGLFVAYWVAQPTSPAAVTKAGVLAPVPPAPKRLDPNVNNGIRSGDDAWVKQYDKDKGHLSSEFHVEQYPPRPNGTIDVTNPIAKFFLANDQWLEVKGVRGNVVVKDMPSPARGGFMNSGPSAPPSHGRLDEVTVTLFDETRPP